MSGSKRHFHIVGAGGAGMSALAQFYAMEGAARVTGSDRLFDAGGGADLRRRLERTGVEIVAQDGSGVDAGTSFVAVSTAIEDANPDIARARALGVDLRHRSDCLKAIAESEGRFRPTIVAGTSGKSSVVAMTWEIVSEGGERPVSLLTGGAVNRLRARGLVGNAFNAGDGPLIVEGDESDGTLVKYDNPFQAVMLNMSKDHKELDELEEIYGAFLRRCRTIVINGDDDNIAKFRSPSFYAPERLSPRFDTFGLRHGDLVPEDVELGPEGSSFTLDGVAFELPVPGLHNVFNAVAAAAAARNYDFALADCARFLKGYQGVHRRFEKVGTCDGIQVIDDFAHNPEKIRAAIAAAHLRAKRVLAVYQPHGFFPTKLLRHELVAAFIEALEPADKLWLPDIYYVGGTADKTISSADLAGPVAAAGRDARHVPGWDALTAEVVREAKSGDLVLVMGARDPGLTDRAREILRAACVAAQSCDPS